MTEIKPCPFCGIGPVTLQGNTKAQWVYCDSCDANGPTEFSAQKAISMWNRVSAAVDLADVVRNTYPDLYDKVMR